MRSVPRLLSIACVALLLAATGPAMGQSGPTPPGQPATGPGGRAYRFATVESRRVGEPPSGFWLFQPAGPAVESVESPERLPLVVFLHGFTAVDPAVYRAWIDHIVRRGAVVVYPDYQTMDAFGTPADAMLPNAAVAVGDAVALLGRESAPVETGSMALVGHSLGGVLAAGLAATAETAGLPRPVALMPVNPGGCRGCGPLLRENGVDVPDLRGVPADVRTLVVVSDADEVARDLAARRIWQGLSGVPIGRRAYVVLRSDRRGVPALVADHLSPQTAGRGSTEDALDWYGTWKMFDLLLACATGGVGCDDAGYDAALRFMGSWSDGAPVRELLVGDAPFVLGEGDDAGLAR